MMNFRKLFVIGAAVAAIGVAGASMAQTSTWKPWKPVAMKKIEPYSVEFRASSLKNRFSCRM